MADPNDLYEAYAQANLDSGGRLQKGSSRMGGLFGLEGPESAGQFVDIPGFGSSPGGRLAAMMELRDNLDFENEDLFAGYLDDIAGRTKDDNFSIPVEGLVPDEGGFFTGGGALTTPSGGQFSIGDEDITDEDLADEDLAGMAEVYRSIQDNAIDPELDYFPSGPLGMSLGKAALLEGRVADSDLAAREMLGKEAAFESSPLDDIASLLASLDNTEGNMTAFDRKVNADNFMSQEAEVDSIDDLIAESSTSAADRARIAANAADEDEAMSQSLTPEAIEGGFQAGMQDFMDAAGIDDTPEEGETKEEALERYKKEFSDATGIDASGKVDKSRALMAFGLALMQNKAGKGFNVGRMLTSVSEAGEAALPALDKATADAKAARISAGKYALQQIKSDEDASAAIKSANLALKKELYLKDLEYQNERQLEILKASLEGDEQLVEALSNTQQQGMKIGAKEIKLGRGQDIEYNGRTVWSDPLIDSREVASAYAKTAEGLDTLNQVESLLMDMQDISSNGVGGTAGTQIMSKLITVGNSMGMGLSYPGGDDVSIPDQIEVLQRSVLARFKKFLTQETGNGISNVDVEQIKAALGQLETFGDVDKAVMSVNTIKDLFKSSQRDLDPIVDSFLDRRQYRGSAEGDYQYEQVLKLFDKSFGNVNYIKPIETVDENGVKIMDYDIRG